MTLPVVRNRSATLNQAHSDYPQALPYQAPGAARVAAPGSRRWLTMLLGVVALLIVVNVAAVVVLMQRNQNPVPVPPSSPTADLGAQPNQGTGAATATVDAAAKVVAAATNNQETAPPVAALKLGTGIELAKPAVKHPESLLEAVGGLSVAHLYQSYLNIGLLADAVENETYTDKDALPLLQKVQDLLGGVDQHLTRISKGALEPDDLKALQRMRTISGYLRQQTTSLLAYWKGGEPAQATRYHQAREQAWGQLKEMLGLPE